MPAGRGGRPLPAKFSARIACQADDSLPLRAAQVTVYSDDACNTTASSVPLYTEPLGACTPSSEGRASRSVYCSADGSAVYRYDHTGSECTAASWTVVGATPTGQCLGPNELSASARASLSLSQLGDNSPWRVKYSCSSAASPAPLTPAGRPGRRTR